MGSFADKLVAKTNAEFAKYRGVLENASPLKQRIGEYWAFLNLAERDGSSDFAWSAAFVSYMVHLAGAGAAFPYSSLHAFYIYRTINDYLAKKQDASFCGLRLIKGQVIPGDILGMNRPDLSPMDYDAAAKSANYFSHSDIVVAVDSDGIHTIGGNVGRKPGEIGKKVFKWDGAKLYNTRGASQQVFVVIRNSLP
ncbi:DUF2272 domain-containing protein [Oleomonas cavernae]|nr:DUF2272 domain-containing protein [Oleomonas cavernae]